MLFLHLKVIKTKIRFNAVKKKSQLKPNQLDFDQNIPNLTKITDFHTPFTSTQEFNIILLSTNQKGRLVRRLRLVNDFRGIILRGRNNRVTERDSFQKMIQGVLYIRRGSRLWKWKRKR